MSALTISLIQSVLHWEDKEANKKMFEEKMAGLKGKTEIILMPEMFTTGFTMRPQLFAEEMSAASVEWLRTCSAALRCIIAGSMIIKEGSDFFNRLIWMMPNGKHGHYDKRHLFGYSGEDKHYSAGNKRLITSVNGWKLNLQICYDLRFPVWARQSSQAEPEYDILVYVANWPDRRISAWRSLLIARAIENQCYVIGVNRVGADGNGISHSGCSMVVDPLGEILYECKDKEDIFTITLQKETLNDIRTRFPFLKDGDDFRILD